MKILYICEYPYVLYKVLIKAALNKNDIYDIIISNRMEKMMDTIMKIKESHFFRKVYFFDVRKLNLKYDLMLHKHDESIIKQRLYELKVWKYLSHIANKGILQNVNMGIDFNEYDKIYCTDGGFAIENYLTVNRIPHIMMEHARDVHVKKNYSFLAGLFHYMEIILDQCNIITGIGMASKYCVAMEVNSNQGKEQIAFMKKRKLLVWNVKDGINQLSKEKREIILEIYMKSYMKEFNYDNDYNLLLTNPLYIDGDVVCEEDQIKIYQKIIEKYHLNDGHKLLIKPHPRDCINYNGKIDGLLIDSMISSEILCISEKLKLNKVVTLYSSSADAFLKQANEVIRIADGEKEAILFCKKFLNEK